MTTPMSMTPEQLRKEQAEIRDEQRDRMDAMHAHLHEEWRDEERRLLGGQVPPENQRIRQELMHGIIHSFMRDFDRAVLIHERLAQIEGRDPSELTKALWPVRTAYPTQPEDT